MKAKFFILDFINFVFFIALVAFFIYYIILGDRFEAATKLMKFAGQASFFGILFFVRLNIYLQKIKKMVENGERFMDRMFIFYLTMWDKTVSEIIVFLLPILIIIIAYFGGEVTHLDFFQALVVFSLAFFWHTLFFNKAK
ncbi:hypothetical protein A2331_01465 [Candidatus Falkowbacteria bacterium RIFOXYB2_FULL_34_18]|nr:MAG: hypothetical protein A2331_01465 [Candidatus Falkowbacteria bacterium RIFOXYB2_FULL_34_18]OGF36400.1 MAG: hypothetical protein A2466_01005 [Candidatus Falkowbacteria bacterium RIFOXYC2_FULL_34_220]OGF38879.1 MAG: hypothetical protein A2515_05765 [Candidatus Falkowbacteria bacterium RIFOXYD12_FULL_34_57]